jgi:UDP-N-acetylmuramate--alanine ligase
MQQQLFEAQDWRLRLTASDPTLRIHLLGIGGAGLNAIAQVLLEQGFTVSGSDRQHSPVLARLAQRGVQLWPTQRAENLLDLPPAERPDVVLISSAVDGANPERQAAEQLGIPVVKRADFLPVLLGHRRLVAVAGTAGKTTTTAMIVKVLRDAGLDIGYIIGAELPGYGNAAAGSHPCFVLEADEYDHMFLTLQPEVAVITNVVWDHPDCYPTPESFWQAFKRFTDNVPANGLVITCADDLGAERLYEERPMSGPCYMTYGLEEYADVRARHVRPTAEGTVAELWWWHAPKGQLQLPTPGLHMIRNALAVLAVANWADVPFRRALDSLGAFQGTARRFEVKGRQRGVTVIDDYAHHPTKVEATLAAARQRFPSQRIWAVFQPHTFSRTRHLLADFAHSFSAADRVIITAIYAAREADDGSIQAADLAARLDHPAVQVITDFADIVGHLASATRPGDVVVVMGAGDSYKVGEMLLVRLGER